MNRRLRLLIHRSESNTREIARGGLINAGSAGLGALASFALLVVVTRGTSLVETGLFFQALALATAASLVTSLGASTSMTRTVAGIPRHQDQDASTAIWAGLLPVCISTTLVGVAGAVAADTLASHLTSAQHQTALANLIVPMMLAVPLMAVTRFCCAVSRAVDEPLAGALYDLAGQPLLRLATACVLILTHRSDTALGLTVLLPAAVCVVGAVIHTRRALGKAGITCSMWPRWDLSTAWRFWRFSAPRGIEEVVQASNIWLLTLLVGALASASEAAAYAAITRYTMATTLVLQSVTTALLPRLAAAFHRGEYAEANRIFQRTTQWVIVASVPVCFALLLFPGTLLNLVSPDLLDVRLGLRILALGSMVNVVTGPVGGVVLMAGRSTINLAAAALAMVGMLVPALVLVPAHGANAASLAWAISIVIQNVLLYLYCRRKLSMSPWTKVSSVRTLQGVAVVAFPMVLAVLVLHDTWAGCVAGVAASCVILVVWIAHRVRRAA